ncbi:MAG: hypothetical protein V3U57_03585 [Robiginitomaculum sp.]
MDCRLNYAIKAALLSKIETHIKTDQPFSLLRLGDGESYAWDNVTSAQNTNEVLKMREYMWWNTCLEPYHRAQIQQDMYEAISKANMLGIPSLYRFTRDASTSLISYEGHRSTSGLLRVLKGVSELPDFPAPSSREFTEDRIHHICFNFEGITKLARHAKKNLIISSLKPAIISQLFAPYIGNTPLITVSISTHTKTQKNDLFVSDDEPIPFIYKKVAKQIAKVCDPGTLGLVAGGAIGKIFCETIRAHGGVALDVGSMADYWVGAKTRSVADLI